MSELFLSHPRLFLTPCRSDRRNRMRTHTKSGDLYEPTTLAATGGHRLAPLGLADPLQRVRFQARNADSASAVTSPSYCHLLAMIPAAEWGIYAVVGGVCQGAAHGGFPRLTSSFQVGAEGNHQTGILWVSFGQLLVILLVQKKSRCRINDNVRIAGSSTCRATGRDGERGLEPGQGRTPGRANFRAVRPRALSGEEAEIVMNSQDAFERILVGVRCHARR